MAFEHDPLQQPPKETTTPGASNAASNPIASQDDDATKHSAPQLPASPGIPPVQLLSSGAGARALTNDHHEFENLLFQAMWTEDDANSTAGRKKLVNLVVTHGSTKQIIHQARVSRDKQGNSKETRVVQPKSITGVPIIPLALVRIINSSGAGAGNKYLVRIINSSGERDVYLPFGLASKTIRELQEILERGYSVAMDEHEATRLARSLEIVCGQERIMRGNAYRAAFEELNPGMSFKSGMQDGGAFVLPRMSSEGAVFIDHDGQTTQFGAPDVIYAYAESGWNPRMMQDPNTGEWSQNGMIHVLEGDPLYAGTSFYRSGGGGIVHRAPNATAEGWRNAFRRFTGRSPLIGAIAAQAMGALGRGLLETAQDVSGILYLNGPSGRGKSTATRVAASIIGWPNVQTTARPSPLVNANQTGVSFDRIAQSIRHGFMAIDEIQQNQGSSIAEFIMRLANGMGRGRSQQAGTVNQDQAGWDLTVLINGNDEMAKLLETGKREHGGSKFMEAIQARLLDINIGQIPVFPAELEGNQVVSEIKIENDAAMVELEKHHGVFYSQIVQWLSDNRDRATQIFRQAEEDYLRRYATEDYEHHIQRSSKNAGYEAVGFAIMEEVIGLAADEIAQFSECWAQILESNADLMRKETADGDAGEDLHDLIMAIDGIHRLGVCGHFCERDDDGLDQQLANARARSINGQRLNNAGGWLFYLDQSEPMHGSGRYSGTLYVTPTGSGKWADPALRELRAVVDKAIDKCHLKGMVEMPRTGRGMAQARTIGGKKERVVVIDLRPRNQRPIEYVEPEPKSAEELAAEQDMLDAFNDGFKPRAE